MLIPDIRRVYSRPWRNGGFANPGKVPTCGQVAVRPETTVFAHETMPDAGADVSTGRNGRSRGQTGFPEPARPFECARALFAPCTPYTPRR